VVPLADGQKVDSKKNRPRRLIVGGTKELQTFIASPFFVGFLARFRQTSMGGAVLPSRQAWEATRDMALFPDQTT
jgi:hypothetical protein